MAKFHETRRKVKMEARDPGASPVKWLLARLAKIGLPLIILQIITLILADPAG